MADMIQISDGSVHIIFDDRDALELIGSHMGLEIQRWLEERLYEEDADENYIEELEKEADALRVRHKEVMAELRKHSETIAGLIREKEIDRKALSNTAGAIGCITWREVNR